MLIKQQMMTQSELMMEKTLLMIYLLSLLGLNGKRNKIYRYTFIYLFDYSIGKGGPLTCLSCLVGLINTP